MTIDQQRATLAIALMSAFADGGKDTRERDLLERIVARLAGEGGSAAALDPQGLYEDVVFGRLTVQSAGAALGDDELARRNAYQMAVGVANADGSQNERERAFLTQLRAALRLSDADAAALEHDALTVADAAWGAAGTAVAGASASAASSPAAADSPALAAPVDRAALDKSILNYSILNGALELLPASWATMAIIPLQTQMVYRIGKAHGYELDSGHIKEFLATVGVGLASQYLEQAGRRLIGGLFGKLAGGLVGGVARGATGMAFSFASTYALGQLAMRYYGSGRSMSTDVLKQTFDDLLGPAKAMQARYVPQIEEKARGLNMGSVMDMLRGSRAG
ncbi:MAG: GTPase [Burkholderiales bacterium]|nr:GTPase [Burkholderiales bacterium]